MIVFTLLFPAGPGMRCTMTALYNLKDNEPKIKSAPLLLQIFYTAVTITCTSTSFLPLEIKQICNGSKFACAWV